MNLESINKWLDEEYGCSYTKLEELHDFYFEKYSDLQQENKQLKDNWKKLKEYIPKEYKRLHGINMSPTEYEMMGLLKVVDKMHELEQGSDSDE